MNRRAFLQGLAAAFAAPIVAKIAAPISKASESTGLFSGEIGYYTNVRFIETQEFGNAISISCRGAGVTVLVEKAKQLLLMDARKTLPKGTKFAILDGGEGDYGRVQHLAWYYSPNPISELKGRNVIAEAIA